MTLYLVTTEPADAIALHRPKLILPIGSGGAGKSFWSRWFIERAAKRSAPLDICDADPLSPVLAPLAHDANGSDCAPGHGLHHQHWLERKITASAKSRRSLILDPGPRLFGLIEWFTDVPVALGPRTLASTSSRSISLPPIRTAYRASRTSSILSRPRAPLLFSMNGARVPMTGQTPSSTSSLIRASPPLELTARASSRCRIVRRLTASTPFLPQPQAPQSGALRLAQAHGGQFSLRSPLGSTDIRQAYLS